MVSSRELSCPGYNLIKTSEDEITQFETDRYEIVNNFFILIIVEDLHMDLIAERYYAPDKDNMEE